MLHMTENEIYQSYMGAADKKKQIPILAQLNACDEDEIKRLLVRNGRPLEEIYPPKRKRRTKAEMLEAVEKEKQEAAAKKDWEEPKIEQARISIEPEEDIPGAITGGEGDIEEYMQIKPYRSAAELEDEPDDMTEHEKERLKNIRAIPLPVKEIVQAEIGKLCKQVMELEKRHDALVDYLNGEQVG